MAGSYKDLRVWQNAMALVSEIYKLTARFPNSERFGLTNQLRRAAVSVPSNIAEGQGRLTVGEFRQFLGTSRGSLYEVETQLRIAIDLQMVDEAQMEKVMGQIAHIARQLNALLASLRSNN